MSYKIAGIDVHKKVLTLSWLPEQGVKEAVMESTARPVLAAGVVGIGAMHALIRSSRRDPVNCGPLSFASRA